MVMDRVEVGYVYGIVACTQVMYPHQRTTAEVFTVGEIWGRVETSTLEVRLCLLV